ncbi:MAG: hypothetical protein SCARUB_02008 [Candidatus Scalindua rubra]|uniref:Uncharacterized protein n=1 Tax=Candidatus Scalindua rubra TaxID=1872076 RepID=A0A1E3XB76_9BACT|nr:MAG: hypothetical protein SCARUB_02008 [Candidatus Scalindua rubra]
MKQKSVREFKKTITNADIFVSNKIKKIHPVVEIISKNLSEIELIKFIRIKPDFIQASSEVTEGRIKTPITKPDHPTAVGLSLIIDFAYNNVQFYEINSAVKGYGRKMVDAVFKSLPNNWSAVVVMDWSDGFWDKMQKSYKNLEIM